MDYNKCFGFIQNDNVGDIIDIFILNDHNEDILENFQNDENYTVLPLLEAVQFAKDNPQKKFFIYDEDDEIKKLITDNGLSV